MTNQTLTLLRKMLLVLAGILLGATITLFFLTGKFNFAGAFIALVCLAVFLFAGRKQVPGGSNHPPK